MAFAANSVFCRWALGEASIDPASFTAIRLLSGTVILVVLVALANARPSKLLSSGSWLGALMLFIYAAAFSFAYVHLTAATGALVLFGSVQICMFGISVYRGTTLSIMQWSGLITAFMGLMVLLIPDVAAPSLLGFVLMTLSGFAWGVYSLLGQTSQAPLLSTGANFCRTLPFVSLLLIFTFDNATITQKGVLLAMGSGGLASAIGYAIWYKVLPHLQAATAATSQLTVPLITALGGVVFISESITLTLIAASVLTLGGIYIVIKGKKA
ncbi:DMT family transporter [Alteromonas sp. ASW11-36]|uniref:DMT family transporter n=1 Tax=Alteromonas arenosi TaxID=3055817 RepID=A0ABT7SXQ7_9ALTE|nr:DMT family transporter [Alteromonas sp. ASW11-36]MDM7860955.1 DMT family transporter [Alteromonas sp. ASW11-36]